MVFLICVILVFVIAALIFGFRGAQIGFRIILGLAILSVLAFIGRGIEQNRAATAAADNAIIASESTSVSLTKPAEPTKVASNVAITPTSDQNLTGGNSAATNDPVAEFKALLDKVPSPSTATNNTADFGTGAYNASCDEALREAKVAKDNARSSELSSRCGAKLVSGTAAN